MSPDTVLRFWFGDPTDPDYRKPRPLWFAGGPAADAAIRASFGAAVETALAGGFAQWLTTTPATLALVLLLDQFTRNIYRGTPRAFAGDARAQQVALQAITRGEDHALAYTERWFLYLPLEHAESRELQAQSVARFEALVHEAGVAEAKELELNGALDYARSHASVIARFGRFPHRNAILGRISTPEEIAFLAQPASSF